MKAKALTFFKYALPLLVAVLLLRYYVFEEISLDDLLVVFRKADYTWLFVSGLFATAAHLSRAYRWKMLLQPLGYSPNLFKMFLAVMVGYFANLLLPRMGEVTRCGMLNRMDGVQVNAAFGTVVAERIFDVLMLLIVFFLTFLLEFSRLSHFFIEFLSAKFIAFQSLSINSYFILTSLFLLFLALVIIIYKYRVKLGQFTFLAKVKAFLQGMLDGLLSVRRMKHRGTFVFLTIFIWVMYYGMSYVLFFSLPQTQSLGLMAGLTVLLMGGLGNSAPVQGGTGTFHILVGSALAFYGLSQEDGIKLATFMWASQTLLILFLGGASFLISLFIQRKSVKDNPTVLKA